MELLRFVRELFCSHCDEARRRRNGLLYLECLKCGRETSGIPVGPGWRLHQ